MKKLFTVLALCVSALGIEKACANSYSDYFSKSSLELNAGYRTDDLNFRIGCPLQVPDTLAKVHFDDIRLYQFGARLRTNICNCFYFRGIANVGQIYSGKSRVTTFFFPCDSFDVERFHEHVGRGQTWDLSGALGYQFCACDNQLIFTPLLGYSAHEQRLRRFGPVHGYIDQSFFSDSSRFCSSSERNNSQQHAFAKGGCSERSNCCFDSVKCVSSRWRARWSGPWVGFDLDYAINCALDFYGAFEYHWAHFTGKGRWNWADKFVDDFHQSANGNGQTYTLGLSYRYWDCWAFGVEANFQQWRTRRGRDHAFLNGTDFSGGESSSSDACFSPAILNNRLNHVRWDSFSLTVTTAYLF